MGDFTTIPVRRETRNLLRLHGISGESYDTILRRLLRKASPPGIEPIVQEALAIHFREAKVPYPEIRRKYGARKR